MSNYRIIISYLPDKSAFRASVPELRGCEVEAPSRSEALARAEEEIEAQLGNIREQGGEVPEPIEAQSFDGCLSVNVTPELHRELAFLARVENVDLSLLLNELLLRAVQDRWSGRGAGRGRPRGPDMRGRGREPQGARYHEIMENQADFLEYVRRLETSGNPHGRPGQGGGRGGRR